MPIFTASSGCQIDRDQGGRELDNDLELTRFPEPDPKMRDRALTRFGTVAKLRSSRYADFAKFKHYAGLRIYPIAYDLEEVVYFLPYGFGVFSDDNSHESGPNEVRVMFDKRQQEVIGGNGDKPIRVRYEAGSTLRYVRTPTGNVVCTVHPALLDGHEKHDKRSVLLEVLHSAKDITDARIRRHLRDLATYMAMTSLDGGITPAQKRRAWVLRHLKRYTGPDGKWRHSNLQQYARELLKWTFTVGISGVLLLIISSLLADQSSTAGMQGPANGERRVIPFEPPVDQDDPAVSSMPDTGVTEGGWWHEERA